ncbi:hypothetical protein JZM24_00115 [Candidatus Sodalis endolongispinus]|uniref:Uncharacterized protein n=1 Tax=Candidatus Sodalis endolongispinus TaxID=2812662 RepID=A0ABS5YA23_9GAMM|nr:hypothetical protein [Candidatus Sodalis endolongispinus]MBT9430976.1 hypothetical protein [Candidatus Sodalis endolongispinus]
MAHGDILVKIGVSTPALAWQDDDEYVHRDARQTHRWSIGAMPHLRGAPG